MIEPFPGTFDAPLLAERVLSWTEVGLLPAGAERAAIGPEWPAFGPRGEIALYDRVAHRVLVVDGPAFAVSRADDLLYAADGALMRLDDDRRTVTAYDATGDVLDVRALPTIVPPGGRLGWSGATLLSVDLFGNGHPVATWDGVFGDPNGPSLVPPARPVRRNGTTLRVDGRIVYSGRGRVAGTVLGQWLLVEDRRDDRLDRVLVDLDGGGTSVPVVLAPGPYRPSREFAVSPDGRLLWMSPQDDGLHLREVR